MSKRRWDLAQMREAGLTSEHKQFFYCNMRKYRAYRNGKNLTDPFLIASSGR